MSDEVASHDIAIVGGGIAGVCLALGLLKQDVHVTVYEAAHSFHEIGGGVSVGPNARRALRLLGPEVYDAVEILFTRNGDPEESDTFFNFRIGASSLEPDTADAKLVANVKCEGGQSAVHRAHLLDELVKLLPKDIAHFGKKLAQIEEVDQGNSGYRLLFYDGTEATHAHVIGCDGIKSAVRQYILGSDSPAAHAHFAKKYVHRGVIPMDKAITAVGSKLATNATVYMGKNGYVNTLPINHGKSMNVGLFRTMPSWPYEDKVIPSHSFPRTLQADYAHFGPTVHRLIPLMENTDIWALFDHAEHPAPAYVKSRTCIIGDAAHATTPAQGAGAGMAMEDAFVLSSLVGHAVKAGVDMTEAFRAYDLVRRPRTQLLVRTSREAGRVWSFERTGLGDDVETLRTVIGQRWGWIWEGDLLGEVEEGRRWLEAGL